MIEAPGGARLTYAGMQLRRAVDIPAVLEFILAASVQVELALFSAWLYDKTRRRPGTRLIVRQRVITEITPERIRQVLEEEGQLEEP